MLLCALLLLRQFSGSVALQTAPKLSDLKKQPFFSSHFCGQKFRQVSAE